MDPCPYICVLIDNLTLSLSVASRSVAGVHPSSSPCFCVIRFNHQKLSCPVAVTSNSTVQFKQDVATTFYLKKADLDHLLMKKSPPKVKISIYKGLRGAICGVSSRRLLGRVKVHMSDLVKAEENSIVFVNGWVGLGSGRKEDGKLHLTVRSEPDPRYVFEFDGEPECSPQIAAVNGEFRQPAFSCKFQNSSLRSRSLTLETLSPSSRNLPKERKGWCITIHDLTGSTVAMASMQTPFVASPGTDRVSSSNPGSWIIFHSNGGGSHKGLKPWGRLTAWRERGGSHDRLGYKFELLPDLSHHGNNGGVDVCLAESSIDMDKGGSFVIDLTGNVNLSPGCSPKGRRDIGSGQYPSAGYSGFVMTSSVGGEGRCSKPSIEVGLQHLGCMEDAAAFVALAAAVDLSVDACGLFSRRLRKELRWSQDSQRTASF